MFAHKFTWLAALAITALGYVTARTVSQSPGQIALAWEAEQFASNRASRSNFEPSLVMLILGVCPVTCEDTAATPYAGQSVAFVKAAYAQANVSHDYLNVQTGREAMLMAWQEPGWHGAGSADVMPLGAIVFWYVLCDSMALISNWSCNDSISPRS